MKLPESEAPTGPPCGQQIGDRVAYQVLRQREFPRDTRTIFSLRPCSPGARRAVSLGFSSSFGRSIGIGHFGPVTLCTVIGSRCSAALPFEIYERFKNTEYIVDSQVLRCSCLPVGAVRDYLAAADESQRSGGVEDADVAPGMQDEQVFVAGDNQVGACA